MRRKILFKDSFLISGIMCFQGCGYRVQQSLNRCIKEWIEKKLLPEDARLIIYSEPEDTDIHHLFLYIESETEDTLDENLYPTLSAKFKEKIGDNTKFKIIEGKKEELAKKSNKINWINIAINLTAMALIISLTLLLPPSIMMTMGLASFSFLVTAFTAREYLIRFFRNLRYGNLANMATTISLGWFLSLGHMLFHTLTMPLTHSFSMIFMNFIMPIMLMTCVNTMDEIKRLIIEKSKKLRLQGIKSLFPQMSEKYRCHQLSPLEMNKITAFLQQKSGQLSEEIFSREREYDEKEKQTLQEGMLIEVKRGACFPVDCVLAQGKTIVDASLLTGEPQQSKQLWQDIPAGAVNLGQKTTVYATKNTYNSTANSLLFRSNRARNSPAPKTVSPFAYFYTALVIIGLVAAMVTPIALGTFTMTLVMQNVIGVLFSICPCTIAIAHQLPTLISLHHRNNKKIHLRDESLCGLGDKMHTIIFDKTGTLTTGNSVVESSSIPFSLPLWQRIYLLEKEHGGGHPLAKAIVNYYESNADTDILFNHKVLNFKIDPKNRGLSAVVQGKIIHLGNEAYIRDIDKNMPKINQEKIEQGFSSVYVAEDNIYRGVIFIKHEPRKEVKESLFRLKTEGKKIIMLTGDSELSAKGFNKQIGSVFEEKDIHAQQTPEDKEFFLEMIMKSKIKNPKGVWFVGDGLNDAPCCRMVSELGGMSCAMDSNDKTAFFTDICFNRSLDYLFHHSKLNRFLRHNIIQNQWLLTYSILALLAFIISFSVIGIAVSPLIPMAIMLSTTLFVLFNSYRVQLAIDNALDKTNSWLKKILASNFSVGLLTGASALLIYAALMTTITTGGLIFPLITFTAGALIAFCSVCNLTAIGLLSSFILLLTTHLVTKRFSSSQEDNKKNINHPSKPTFHQPTGSVIDEEKKHQFNSCFRTIYSNKEQKYHPHKEHLLLLSRLEKKNPRTTLEEMERRLDLEN